MILVAGRSARIRRVASGPVIPGSRTSISTRSGSRLWASTMASSPEAASPTRVSPAAARTSSAAARRNAAWSSTTSTRSSAAAGTSALPFGQVHQGGPDPRMVCPIPAQAEFGEDRIDVLLHRMLGEEQFVGDGRIGAALGDARQYLTFARGEPRNIAVAGQRPSRDEGFDHLRVDGRPPAGDPDDGGQQV